MSENVMIERKLYTEWLKEFVNTDLIKAIIGLRRSGKSSLLKLFQKSILEEFTDPEHIISINFEDKDFDPIKSEDKLHEYVLSRMKDKKKYYVFIDEVQEVEGWEKCINSLRLRNTDIYITGSNSKLISSEITNLLGGRCVQCHLHTLSFSEFMDFRRSYGISSAGAGEELEEYIRTGGFPILSTGRFSDRARTEIITGINSTAILRDVINRNNIRNVPLLDMIIAFVYDNIGNAVSAKKISDFLKGQRRNADIETVHNYLRFLEEGMIIHKIQRYDIRGKRLLETFDKYYLAEHSLQYTVRGYNEKNLPGLLENIVFLELLRRGYTVSIGRLHDKEVDFVAEKGKSKVYLQVCYLLGSSDTTEREFGPLREIRDSHTKLVVTMDRFWQREDSGVRGIHLTDFLLSDRWESFP